MVRSASDNLGRDDRDRSVRDAPPSARTSSSGLAEDACDGDGACVARLARCWADARRDRVLAAPGRLLSVAAPSSASREEGVDGAPRLARVARGGAVFAYSPETVRVRGDRCRTGPFGTERLAFEEGRGGVDAVRRSCEGMERSFGLRKSPPERLSREGLARRAADRGGLEAGGAMAAADETAVAEDEKTGSREAGRGRPLARGVWVRSDIATMAVAARHWPGMFVAVPGVAFRADAHRFRGWLCLLGVAGIACSACAN